MGPVENTIYSIIALAAITYFIGSLITFLYLLYWDKDAKNAEEAMTKDVHNGKIQLIPAGIMLALAINGAVLEWPWYWYRRLRRKIIKK